MPNQSRKWWISIGVAVALSVVAWVTGTALAAKQEGGSFSGINGTLLLGPRGGASETMAFTYQGRLTESGVPVTGNYDFIIDLYNVSTIGSPVASCANVGTGSLANQPVQNGTFTFYLLCGTTNSATFTSDDRYVQVQARRTGTSTYTTLPRQPISPAPYAFSLYPGAIITNTASSDSFGGGVLNVGNSNVLNSAIFAQSASGSAARGQSNDGIGLYGYTETGYGVYGYDGGSNSGRGAAGYFRSDSGIGVLGENTSVAYYTNNYTPGVYGHSTNGVGVYGRSDLGSASGTSAGVMGYGYSNPGGKFYSYNGNLIEGWEAVTSNLASTERRFRVSFSGNVYADGTYYGAGGVSAGSADLAEMVRPGQGQLEPGDVLAIDPDGNMVRSSTPFQSSVAGIYSTKPGFIAGNKVDNDGNSLEPERIPMAVVGIVPVKVTAENGAIRPGDLLTTSSTPGHAMRAGPNPAAGTIIGKALGALKDGTGVIQMLVTLQ